MINHVQHIGIPVTDIIASEAFYNRLGFDKVMDASFTNENGNGTCIMMKNKEALIELYQLPEKELTEIKSRQNGHIDHIAFDVHDIDSCFRILKDASFHIVEEKPVFLSFWAKGCRYFNILGPDGERLEFNQII